MGPQPKPEKTPQESSSFRDQLKPLGKMPTLEHFFNFYVHMKKPAQMPREIDIHFFRDDRVPMWEVSLLSRLQATSATALLIICVFDGTGVSRGRGRDPQN